MKLQQVIDSYHKLKEERLSKRETILDAVDKYVEENGFEALEKRIALKVSSYSSQFRRVLSKLSTFKYGDRK